MYADDCVLFASSEADLQVLYSTLAEVFKAEGMLISISKTEASVYRAWVNASTWLEPNLTHEDGTKVQEARAFKYLGQRKERKGAQTEVNVRIGDANAAWQALKTKIFHNRRLSVQLRIRIYSSGHEPAT